MPIDEYDDIVSSALSSPRVAKPRQSNPNKITFQPPDANWSLDRVADVQSYYQKKYGKPLPLANKGQGGIHNRLGFDHRNSADISVNPSTPEGQDLLNYMRSQNMPFLAFNKPIPGVATGPHIHGGFPSHRTKQRFSIGAQTKSPKADPYDEIADSIFQKPSTSPVAGTLAENQRPPREAEEVDPYDDIVASALPSKSEPSVMQSIPKVTMNLGEGVEDIAPPLSAKPVEFQQASANLAHPTQSVARKIEGPGDLLMRAVEKPEKSIVEQKYQAPASTQLGRAVKVPFSPHLNPTQADVVKGYLTALGPEYAKFGEKYKAETGRDILSLSSEDVDRDAEGNLYVQPSRAAVDVLNAYVKSGGDIKAAQAEGARIAGERRGAVSEAEAKAAPELAQIEQIRKNAGEAYGAERVVGAPFGREIGSAVKEAGGLAKYGKYLSPAGMLASAVTGISPEKANEYLNAKGNAIQQGFTLPPLTKEGKEIERGIPEKVATKTVDLGLTVGKIILLKKVTGLSMGNIMAAEAALQNTDKPKAEQAAAIAEAQAMGRTLEGHLSRTMSSAMFAVPTAARGAQSVAVAEDVLARAKTPEDKAKALKARDAAITDALLGTVFEATAGGLLAGKKGAEEKPQGLGIETAPTVGVPGEATANIDRTLAQREESVKPTFLRDDQGREVARVLNPEEVASGAKPKIRPLHQADTQLRNNAGRFTVPESPPEPANTSLQTEVKQPSTSAVIPPEGAAQVAPTPEVSAQPMLPDAPVGYERDARTRLSELKQGGMSHDEAVAELARQNNAVDATVKAALQPGIYRTKSGQLFRVERDVDGNLQEYGLDPETGRENSGVVARWGEFAGAERISDDPHGAYKPSAVVESVQGAKPLTAVPAKGQKSEGEPLSPAQPTALELARDEAKAKLDALGPEPPKPSSEARAFGSNGKEASRAKYPEQVARWEAETKAYNTWRRKYGPLQKAAVEASNAAFYEKQSNSKVAPPSSPSPVLGEGVQVPETPQTIAAQMEALQSGTRDAVLVPEGTQRPKIPKGLEAIRTSEGVVYFDPAKISAETIKQKVADGSFSELLGHVAEKPALGEPTATVTAKSPEGVEVQSSAVSPEKVAEQAAATQAQNPTAKVEIGGNELAQKVVGERAEGQTSIKNAALAADREAMGLPGLSEAEHKSWQASLDAAKAKGLAGDRADELADRLLSGRHRGVINDEESAGLELRIRELQNRHQELTEQAWKETDPDKIHDLAIEAREVEDKFNTLSDASKKAGSHIARALAFRRSAINENYDLVSLKRDFKVATGYEPTGKNLEQINALSREIARLNKAAEESQAKGTAAKTEDAVRRIQREVAREARKGTRQEKAKTLDVEAAEIKDLIAQAWKKTQNQTGVQPSVFARLDPEGEILKLVTQLARNRVSKGIVKGAELVDAVHEMLADATDLTKREVAEIISGYGKPIQRRSDLEKQLADLRSELKRTLAEEDVAKGVRSPRAEGPKLSEAVGLKEGPQLGPKQGPKEREGWRRTEGPRLSEATGRKEGPRLSDAPKLGPRATKKATQARLEKKIAEIEDRLNRGDFSDPAKRGETVFDAETQKIADRLEAKKNEYQNLKRRNEPGAAWRNAAAMRKAWLLSWVKTHVRNIVGTGLYQPFDELSRPLAASVDAAMSLRFGGERSISGLSPSAAMDSMFHAMKVGGREAKDILRQGATREDMARHQFQEVDAGAIPGLNRLPQGGIDAINLAHNAIFRFMSASDRVFFQQAKRRNLLDRAKVQAKNEALTDKRINVKERAKELADNPSEQLDADATHDAYVSTFNNSNAVSDTIKMARGYLSKQLGPKRGAAANFAIDLFMPFDRTPTNVIARVLEASPVGFIKAGTGGYKKTPWKVAKSIIDKSMTREERRQFAQAVGHAGTGSAVIALGAILTPKGILTVDDKGNVMLNALGRKVNVSQLSPIGNLLGIGAKLYDEHSKEGLTVGKVAKIAARTPLDQPLLRGTSQITEVLRDPERSAGKQGASLAFSAVPFSGAVRGMGEAIDPAETRYADSSFKQQFQKNVPRWREDLPSEKKGDFQKRLLEQKRAGQNPDLDEAVRSERITKAEQKAIERDSELTPAQVTFSNMHADKALARYGRMNENERLPFRGIIERHAWSLLHSDAITDSQKEKFREQIDALGIVAKDPRKKSQEFKIPGFKSRFMLGANP